ncbi:tetratricopeptide repeat protein [Sorangium sp. So ce1000]|uniref:tetratricopeptide repeat protein n=1 Tax=Sorangium sp. So ce1000 TaxID=3133325 RepID=UPI003F63D97B
MERSPDWLSLCTEGLDLAAEDAEALETHLLKSSNDIEARAKLLGFYFTNPNDDAQQRRAGHVHWLIAHRPEIHLAAFARIHPEHHPDAYNEGKRLWLSVVSNSPNNLAVLRNAGSFLASGDPDIAEELYKRGAAIEPDESVWWQRLGGLHFRSSIGSISSEERKRFAREALAEYEAALTLERCSLEALGILMDIAEAAIMSEDYQRATEAAERILVDAEDHADSFQYGNAVHLVHIALGKVALSRGEPAIAAAHLRAASEVRGSPQLKTFGPDLELASQLLAIGQRDAVTYYIDSCKRFWDSGASLLEKWTLAIGRGETPDFSTRRTTVRS